MRLHTPLITIAASLLASAPTTLAGDLAPPAGPVAPTMKTLDQVEPRIPIGPDTTPGDAGATYRITASGSYYLTENLIGEPAKHGIEIEIPGPDAGDVTIDLNGMSVIGAPGSLTGIIRPSARANVANGIVKSWGADGVQVGAGEISRVSATNNGQDGIAAFWGSLIHDCIAESNARDGVSVGDVSRIDNCVSKVNGRWGIHADGAVTIADCVIYNNDAGGIEAGLAHITGNMLFSNAAGGILDRGFSTIAGNTVHGGAVGIQAQGDDSRVEGNHVMSCIVGIEAFGANNLIIANSVRSSTTSYAITPGNPAGDIVTNPINAGPWDNFEQ
jgi:hypothetical protein